MRGVLTLVALLVLASCTEDEPLAGHYNKWTSADSSYSSAGAMMFSGRWSVGGEPSGETVLAVYPEMMSLGSVPYADIMARLMPQSAVADVRGDATVSMRCTRMQQSATGMLFSLYPDTWHMSAVIDGRERKVRLLFANDAEAVSWATLSAGGVLTVILRPTAFAVDDGDTVPVDLKLMCTATLKK